MRAAEAAEEVGGLGGGLQGARGGRGWAEARAKATEVAEAVARAEESAERAAEGLRTGILDLQSNQQTLKLQDREYPSLRTLCPRPNPPGLGLRIVEWYERLRLVEKIF